MTHTHTTHWVNIGLSYAVQFTGCAGELQRHTTTEHGTPLLTAADATMYACHLRTIGRHDAHVVYTVTGQLDWAALHHPDHHTPTPTVDDSTLVHRITTLLGDHTEGALDAHTATAIAALAVGIAEQVVAVDGK